MVVLVTGGHGQLGQALQAKAAAHKDLQFYFAGSAEADVTSLQSLENIFDKIKPQFCINAAAYTAVDKAESEPDKAFAINVTGAANLATVCKTFGTVLLHISTDFVFDGSKQTPYTEEDETNPQSVYGKTKREGELQIQSILKENYIIRTSWLYSQYSNNFMKTMLRLGRERDTLSVVNDQTGTPTNANDLADGIITIIKHTIAQPQKAHFGLYHFSNEGYCSWYDFAKKIFEINKIYIDLHPILTIAYPTPAKRPVYSVMDKNRIKSAFGISIAKWEDALINSTQ